MTELDRNLGEAQDTYKQIVEAIKASSGSAARAVVPLRTRLATLVTEMMVAIKSDSRLRAKPELSREFDVRFFEMRRALALHQTKWRSANIDEDPDGYCRATDELVRKLDDFFGWAKYTLVAL